ncbi:MAG: hypothetical protein IJX69_03650 [Oscillospiraceae bacterium]|nr:hypothetical protein [Oscillospiraceae bacterium]
MDLLFESVYTDTEALIHEMASKVLFRKARKWVIISGILAAAFLLRWFWLKKPAGLLGSILYVALMLWYLTVPRRYARKQYQQALAYFNGNIPPACVRFGDAIFYQDGIASYTIPYDKLKHLYVMKNSMVFESDVGPLIQLSCNHFTKGTPAELLEFLRQMCPQMNLHIRK